MCDRFNGDFYSCNFGWWYFQFKGAFPSHPSLGGLSIAGLNPEDSLKSDSAKIQLIGRSYLLTNSCCVILEILV